MAFSIADRFTVSLARRSGFTLIELLMAMLIMCILLAMAMPSMRSFISQNRLASEVNLFIAATVLARGEAIKRGRPVLICRSVGANQCAASASGDRDGSDWGSGWLVMEKDTGQVLLRQGALADNTNVKASRSAISYNGAGNVGGTFANLVFSHDGKFIRTVCIGRSGRVNLLIGVGACDGPSN
ncbi:GspH/FimT family pseudopilin [Paraherbaspirillum soli]|uniref:Type II secretion system protein H n=1 Tax=Paraherbaspirillum soli TaxID=631222 RepID=A0ABW0MEZ4_9BURK